MYMQTKNTLNVFKRRGSMQAELKPTYGRKKLMLIKG